MKFFDGSAAVIADDVAENIFLRILSFVDLKTLGRLRQVNHTWRDAIDKRMPILPAIHRIPQLSAYRVDTLFDMGMQKFKEGMTNTTYKLEIKGNKWVLRLPGKGSSAFIDRRDEEHNATLAAALGINVTIDFFDGGDGLELTRYLEGNQALTAEALCTNPRIIPAIAQLFKRLHTSTAPFCNTINVFTRNSELLENLIRHNYPFPEDIAAITNAMERVGSLYQQYRIVMTPCHNDATPSNFLLAGDEIKLLDWEYAGNNDRLWDLAYFALYSPLSRKQEEELLGSYFGECNDLILSWFDLYKPVIAWWVLLWSWTQIANHADACPVESYQELARVYYEITKKSLDSAQFGHALEVIANFASTFSATSNASSTSSTAQLSTAQLVPRPF